MRGDAAAVRALLKQGADVNAAQGDGMTALHWAAHARRRRAGAACCCAPAPTSRATTRIGGYTPLHLAARHGHGAVVEALLAAGADADADARPPARRR